MNTVIDPNGMQMVFALLAAQDAHQPPTHPMMYAMPPAMNPFNAEMQRFVNLHMLATQHAQNAVSPQAHMAALNAMQMPMLSPGPGMGLPFPGMPSQFPGFPNVFQPPQLQPQAPTMKVARRGRPPKVAPPRISAPDPAPTPTSAPASTSEPIIKREPPPPIVTVSIPSSADGFPMQSLLNFVQQQQKATTPTTSTASSGLPQMSLPDISVEDFIKLVSLASAFEQATQAAGQPTAAATSSSSNVVEAPAPVRQMRASPAGSSASQPTTSSTEDNDDGETFVDVETLDDDVHEGKDRRKFHVEFYRKMKSTRQRDQPIICALCSEEVENIDRIIQQHVADHAEAGGYHCVTCGWVTADKYKMYEHMRLVHPEKQMGKFLDKRDMVKMCAVINECFPRGAGRYKKEEGIAVKFLSQLIEENAAGDKHVMCGVCGHRLLLDKIGIVRHVQQFHTIKCKTCRVTMCTMDEQLVHQSDKHGIVNPKMSVHYAPCSAMAALVPALQRCFPLRSEFVRDAVDEKADDVKGGKGRGGKKPKSGKRRKSDDSTSDKSEKDQDEHPDASTEKKHRSGDVVQPDDGR